MMLAAALAATVTAGVPMSFASTLYRRPRGLRAMRKRLKRMQARCGARRWVWTTEGRRVRIAYEVTVPAVNRLARRIAQLEGRA